MGLVLLLLSGVVGIPVGLGAGSLLSASLGQDRWVLTCAADGRAASLLEDVLVCSLTAA